MSIQEIDGKDIALVSVDKGSIETYIKKTNEFYIR